MAAAMLTPGDSLGPFVLLRLLGTGAFGETWLAERPGIVRVPLAVKVLRQRENSQPLAQEAATLLKLAHPHIVPLIEADEYECRRQSYFALVMPYEAGGDLRRCLNLRRCLTRSGLLAHDAHRYACGILDALAYAHAQKVIHRDVKPENIFLRGGEAVLGDFGVAAEVDWRSAVEGVQGTAPYIAPEVWTSGRTGAPADIWALGVTLYEMVVGKHPFPSPNLHQLQYAVLHQEPDPLPPHMPAALAQVIGAALAKDPRGRPKASALLALLGHAGAPNLEQALAVDPEVPPSDPGNTHEFLPVVPHERRVRLQLAAQREPELATRLHEWRGQSIGVYRVNGVAAIGGQAIVLSAARTDNNGPVAIKFPRLPYTTPAVFGTAEVQAARQRLERGWAQATGLHSAGLNSLPKPLGRVVAPNPLHVPQRPAWIREEEAYYVEEWVAGLTLDELGVLVHSDRRWQEDLERLAWTVAREMLSLFDTLAHAQPARVYVDVAPRNFMLNRAWRLRVVDTAAIQNADSVPPRPAVTPSYLDVDNARAWQAKAPIRIDPGSALHAMGRILYRLVTNRLPLAGVVVELNDAIWSRFPELARLTSSLLSPRPDAAAIRELLTNRETRPWTTSS